VDINELMKTYRCSTQRNQPNGSIVCVLLLGLILPNYIVAAENSTVVAEESSEFVLDELFMELDNVTAIATHTKMNIDFVPGMVTVLHGEDLERQGIHRMTEALNTVPGIEVMISNDGSSHIVMRGIGRSFRSGKIKMLVNGHAMNVAVNAASSVEAIPLQLIERIEIIRGPGSAIYGEYAYAGVINVILRDDKSAFYIGSHHNKHTFGGTLSNSDSDSPFKTALNLAIYESAGKQVTAGPDYLKNLNTGAPSDNLFNSISTSPGYSNEVERVFSSALKISYKGYHWDSFFQEQSKGDYFGYQNALPPTVETKTKTVDASSDIGKEFKINENINARLTIGGRYFAMRGRPHTFLPAGFPDKTYGGVFESGVLGSPNYTEYEAHGNIEFNYSGFDDHELMLGLHSTYVDQGDTWARRNVEITDGAIGEVPLQIFRGDKNYLTENNKRKNISVYFQDQWHIIDQLTLTVGGRYDNYFKSGDSFNPRIASVYQLFDNHILKFQLSRAFRPPTFTEMYIRNNIIAEGNDDINPETINTLEGGYIYRKSNSSFYLTAFYSQLNDLISNKNTVIIYQNLENVVSRGLEIELSNKINHRLSYTLNGTLLNVKDSSSDESLPNIANVFGNASLSYIMSKGVSLVVSDQYTGERKREKNDPRDSLDGFHIFNSTINLSNILFKTGSVNFGVKNMFDQKVLHPSNLISFVNNLVPAYQDDLPRPGREFWLNFVYKY